MTELSPRVRLGFLFAFALVTVSLRDLTSLGLALALAVLLALAMRIPAGQTLRRVAAMDGFMLVILATLPFTISGDRLFGFYMFTASEQGLERAFQIILKANAIILAALALAGSLSISAIGHGLAGLGLPAKLAHLLIFSMRMVPILRDELARLRRAMKARAFVSAANAHSWRSYGYLLGMLLLRAHDRAEKMLIAMKCRGYDGNLMLVQQGQATRRDAIFLCFGGFALSGLAFFELAL